MFCFVSCFHHSSFDTFSDYFKSCKEAGKPFMTLSDILQLRNDTTGNYFEFIEHFVFSVVGKKYFKNNWCDQLLSDFTTVSNEALAILKYENNVETWKDMVNKNITKNFNVTNKKNKWWFFRWFNCKYLAIPGVV